MSEEKVLQASEVAGHKSKDDLYLIIHGKVYNTTSFMEEHPGGDEVLLDLGGQDASEAFEDVGHSDEAREILTKLLVGSLEGAPAASQKEASSAATSQATTKDKAGGGGAAGSLGYLLPLTLLIAFVAWKYLS